MKTYAQFQKDKYNFRLGRVRTLPQFEPIRKENPSLIEALSRFDEEYDNPHLEMVAGVANEMLSFPLSELSAREKLRDEILSRPEIREAESKYQQAKKEQGIEEKLYRLYCLLKQHGAEEREMGMVV